MNLTDQEVTRIGTILEAFSTIKTVVFHDRVAGTVACALRNCAGELPPPLVLYAVLHARIRETGSNDFLASLECLLQYYVSNAPRIQGSWRSRAAKLRPRGSGTYQQRCEEFREFRAALFELSLAYRLAMTGASVTVNSEKPKLGKTPDLQVESDGNKIAIEAYAPAQAVKKDYARLEQVDSGGIKLPRPRWSIDPSGVPDVLRSVTHEPGFRRKADQLASCAPQSSLLAVQLLGLVRDFAHLGPYLFRRDTGSFDASVFGCLPSNCAGYLLCLWGDVVGDTMPMEFLPVPGRPVPPEVTAILAQANAVRIDGTGVHGATR
ncbi:MAG: hypothetical protein M1118_13610 [Chloroflexi bacterium]|nr:hypothetical protein [Chloroflexota bacterium]